MATYTQKDNTDIPSLQAIKVRHLGWTATKPARVKLDDLFYGSSKTLYNEEVEGENILDKAINYLKQVGGTITIHSKAWDNKKQEGLIMVSFSDTQEFNDILHKSK